MRRARSVRVLDIALIAAAIAVTILITIEAYASGDARYVSVRSRADEWIYQLDSDDAFAVPGPLGDTIVVIEDGSVRVTESPCKNKICIASGLLTHAGDWAACLPNGVMVHILGVSEEGIDAVVY